jgi:hypothetical protein
MSPARASGPCRPNPFPHWAWGLLFLATAVAVGCDRNAPQDPAVQVADRRQAEPPAKPLFDIKPSTSRGNGPSDAVSQGSAPPSSQLASSTFSNVAARAGLDFTYQTGARGESLMVETMGGGCGVLDFDNDGHPDLFLCQGGDPTAPADAKGQPTDRLFRGGAPGKPFVDVAGQALPDSGHHYSQGVAIGDYDDDGFDDIYITNVGRNTLLHNQGDGTFVDVTDAAGVGDARWSTSAAFADLTGDGLLDLYVCNYVDYDPRDPKDCRTPAGERRICHPQSVDAVADECYVNQGDGTFKAEAKQRGLFGEGNKALGVSVTDFNLDGRPDLYVANDTTANFMFINQGQGQFKEQALLLGCAVDRMGAAQASMGLAVGDYDNDGLVDIYSTHFYDESNTLYRNLGERGFQDVTGFVGLHELTLPRLGFGTAMQDFNQDGHQEIFVTNGHIENYPNNPLHKMRPQLFAYAGPRWQDCSDRAGEFFTGSYVGRGVAVCDYNLDGAPDLIVVHQDTPTALLENTSDRGHWLKLSFRGRASNRRGIGCQVNLRAGQRKIHQQLSAGGSYACSHEPAIFFGLADHAGPVEIDVLWPSGNRQTLRDVPIDQTLVIQEPAARTVDPKPE